MVVLSSFSLETVALHSFLLYYSLLFLLSCCIAVVRFLMYVADTITNETTLEFSQRQHHMNKVGAFFAAYRLNKDCVFIEGAAAIFGY